MAIIQKFSRSPLRVLSMLFGISIVFLQYSSALIETQSEQIVQDKSEQEYESAGKMMLNKPVVTSYTTRTVHTKDSQRRDPAADFSVGRGARKSHWWKTFTQQRSESVDAKKTRKSKRKQHRRKINKSKGNSSQITRRQKTPPPKQLLIDGDRRTEHNLNLKTRGTSSVHEVYTTTKETQQRITPSPPVPGQDRSSHTVKVETQQTLTPSPPTPALDFSQYNVREDPESTNCPNCRLPEEEVKKIRTDQFKELLLKKLRMSEDELSLESTQGSHHPAFPKLPHAILERTLKDNARQETIEDFYARDTELIVEGKDLGRKCIDGRGVTGCYIFELEGKVRGVVASAQLWLYKTPDGNDINGHTMRVFELGKNRRGRLRRKNLISRRDAFIHEGWLTMNVTWSVKRWVDKRMSTTMVAIRCDTCSTRNHKALFGAKNGYTPLLVIEYETSDMLSRKKRTISDHCDPRYECCKRSLVVNFNRINMVSINQPKNLSIGYCFGYCNHTPNYSYNYTQLVQSVRLSDSSINDTIRRQLVPCCIPLTLIDSFFLVFTGDGIIRTTVPNVIVGSCGCV